jgi:gliding motility-associated lipoprotein GldD
MRSIYLFVLFLTISISSCQPDDYIPKRRGFFSVDLPKEHQYQNFDKAGFPYAFEYPVYGTISSDSLFFDKKPENPYWINIDFPSIGGTIYISYKSINPGQSLEKLLEDAHFMSFYHTKKADYQNEYSFHNEHGVHGFVYEWGGDAASKYQFVATDSTKHFIRGALYFNTTPNADSLKPMNDFLRKDIDHMLQTLSWK